MRRWKIFSIIATKDPEKPYWHEIGRGFENRDGSINGHLNSLPFTRKIQLREIQEDEDQDQQQINEMEDPSPEKQQPKETPF